MFALNVNNVSATTTIVLLNWNFQSLVSILFFIYWQRSKSWEHVLRVLHVPQKSAGLAAATPWIRFVAIVASTLTIMLLLAALAVVLQTAGVVEADFPTSLIDMDDCASEQIFDRLMEFFMTHRELANAVRVIDRTFQIYAFVMIGTNIPSTVFSLLPLATAPSETFMHLLVGAVSVAFCIVQLISLTCVPAKLHNRIVQAEQIIYGCQKIWYPHNEKLYSLASTFIAHVNQQNLGVSLWGFAIVTKPLILTVG
ncbi:unnamed protein product [Toxocara canis]|uniref:Transmembrane protein n=1 Tax=Toxocara canis TaxID=6265 RepID=A0A183TXM7_TOXCA|nr:unnamed protein product [Toxocara canis]